VKLFPAVFFSCLCIGFSCAAYFFAGRADASYDSRHDNRAIISVVSTVRTFIRAESLGNRRTVASVVAFTRVLEKHASALIHTRAASRKPNKPNTGRIAILPAHPPVYLPTAPIHPPSVRSTSLAYERIRTVTPVNEADVPLQRGNTRRSASYFNYDVFGSPQTAYGTFAYGMRVGSGVAQISTLARAAGDQHGIMLTGLGWRRQSDSGNTLVIGDAQSHLGKYEDSVRFDGVQYAGTNFAYDVGWERTDFGDAAMHFGQFVTEATAWKPLGPRFTAEAHIFGDSGTKLVAIGGIWTTPRFGQLRFGVAPIGTQGNTGFFAYNFTSPRWNVSVDDRIWDAQSYQVGLYTPENYRQMKATLQYAVSPATKVRVGFGTQSQGGFAVHTAFMGFVQNVQGTEVHVDYTQSSSSFARNAGLVTYLSVPLGGGRSVTAQNTLAGGISAKTLTLKQDTRSDGLGTSYAVDFGQNGTSFTDAQITSRSAGSTTQLQLARFAGPLSWSSEFSGAIVFFGGRPFATNQPIDQTDAFDTLKGRSSATVTLVTPAGDVLPPGSIVRSFGDIAQWRIDEDGHVSLTDVDTGPQTLLVTTPSGTCIASITMPPNMNTSYDLGKQICR
jgi:hypothetical protein